MTREEKEVLRAAEELWRVIRTTMGPSAEAVRALVEAVDALQKSRK